MKNKYRVEFYAQKCRSFISHESELIYAESEAVAIKLAEQKIQKKRVGHIITFRKIQKI